MDHSLTLLTAQVHFLDTELVLIHIPLHLYSHFLQAILQFLLPTHADNDDPFGSGAETSRPRRPWVYEHPFVNISITPVECSIACSRRVAQRLFQPIATSLEESFGGNTGVSFSNETYVVIQVDGEGVDAGQRVLELTSPLAMNGISLFFITTYFSDYILVPSRCRAIVIQALEDRGFVFESNAEAFVNVSSPLVHPALQRRGSSSTTSMDFFDAARPPATPPPSSLAELQTRTFSLLRRRNIQPQVDPSIQLVQCAGRRDTLRGGMGEHASTSTNMLEMQIGLVKCLITTPRPSFFSLTLTDTEPASLLLEKELLNHFGQSNDGSDVLLGSKDDFLIPITLDLRDLPMESPGIVCGVAGRLAGGTSANGLGGSHGSIDQVSIAGSEEQFGHGSIEMSYLSTARAGTVMVAEAELNRALDALRGPPGDKVDIASPGAAEQIAI